MGKRLHRLFDEAYSLGGLVGRMRLASMAHVTSLEAETSPDRPEVVQRVQDAMVEIRKQFSVVRDERAPASVIQARPGDDQSRVLRRHLETFLDMMSQRSLFIGDVEATIRRVNEAASSTLDIERVSVWYTSPMNAKIVCADLFERGPERHSSGTELFAKDFAPYFRALVAERTIAVHDAHADPRTACFSEGYLKPLGINSLLDVPIWVGGAMVGVICHEHIGPKRQWTKDEETFAYLMSNFITLALERGGSDAAGQPARRTLVKAASS
jgi:hypothetical protein